MWWRRQREESIEEYAVRQAKIEGGRLEKLPPTPGEKYRPDRVFLRPDRPGAYLELKRPGKDPTTEQLHVLITLRAQGFVAEWASSREQVDAFFEKVRLPPLAMAITINQEYQRNAKTKTEGKPPVAPKRPRRVPSRPSGYKDGGSDQ